jgi:putative hydrolase of the HAD superfamily
MSKYNTISFDAADTLFYIKKGLGGSYYEVLKNYNVAYKPEDISLAFKKFFVNRKGLHFNGIKGKELYVAEKQWWFKLVEDVFNELGMFDNFDKYFDDLYEYFSDEAWEVYSDVIPTLSKLKDDGLNVIITSNFDSRIYGVCRKFDIDKFVDHFTISSESGYSKPDQELFYISLRKANVTTQQSIHVGDNYNLDYVPSLKIGMRPILIDRDNEFDKNIDICKSNDFNKIFEVLSES